MQFPIHFVPANTKIDFMHYRWWGFIISGVLTLASIGIILFHGLNMGIDFTGGVLMELRTPERADLGAMRDALHGQDLGEISLQNFGDEQTVMLRIPVSEDTEQSVVVEKVKRLLNEKMGAGIDYRKIDFVGPAVGKELVQGAILAVLLSFIGILFYIWFRFEWQFGVGVVAALIHDAVMMMGFYAFTQHDFSLPAVAAVLTIIGYSTNDSVVIYDRIRENLRKYRKMPIDELINRSLNDTLSRAIVTHVTVLLAALALVFFGGEALRGFSESLAFGVVVGAYSSIFISAPMLIYLHDRAKEAKIAA